MRDPRSQRTWLRLCVLLACIGCGASSGSAGSGEPSAEPEEPAATVFPPLGEFPCPDADELVFENEAAAVGGASDATTVLPEATEIVLRHEPVTVQPWNHPVPIVAEVGLLPPDTEVCLYYTAWTYTEFFSPGAMTDIRPAARPGERLVCGEIACTMIQPTKWLYFIAVVDARGLVSAHVGSPDEPMAVDMAESMEGPSPVWPDGSDVRDCGSDGMDFGCSICSPSECVPPACRMEPRVFCE